MPRSRPAGLVVAVGFCAAGGILLAGCGEGPDTLAAGGGQTVTVTTTVTATATVTAAPDTAAAPPDGNGGAPGPATPPATPPPLTLKVFADGCGLIRSEPADENTYRNLGWSITDQDGFEVLQRNAMGETRYRYFQGGTYRAVLVAFVGDRYAPVSNEVTITC